MKKDKIKNGKPLARYVYEPYGKINPYLTNLDLDKNQYFYKGKFYYTGMEWEEELQLYNFKARYYDPYTMRFIQPDPVHTERQGFDNYDRYSYVNNNPVNFVDPDGRSFEMLGLCSAMMHISKCIHMGNEIMGKGKKKGGDPTLRKIGEVGTFLWRYTTDPAFMLGFWYSLANYTAGILKWILTGGVSEYPSIEYRAGGYLVKGPLVLSGAGITIGPFANVLPGAEEGIIQHELGHIRQYNEWGGWKYLGHHWDRIWKE